MSEAEVKAIARVHSDANRAHTEKLKTTIAALEKRIAELEKYLEQLEADWSGEEVLRLRGTLTAECKRREECEAALREVANAPNRIAENARIIADYFSRYEGCS